MAKAHAHHSPMLKLVPLLALASLSLAGCATSVDLRRDAEDNDRQAAISKANGRPEVAAILRTQANAARFEADNMSLGQDALNTVGQGLFWIVIDGKPARK